MLSARRSSVATSSTVGKAEKSSGRSIHSATIRISTDSAIEKARPMSIRKDGIGRKKIDRIATMPMAKPMSRPPRPPGRAAPLAARLAGTAPGKWSRSSRILPRGWPRRGAGRSLRSGRVRAGACAGVGNCPRVVDSGRPRGFRSPVTLRNARLSQGSAPSGPGQRWGPSRPTVVVRAHGSPREDHPGGSCPSGRKQSRSSPDQVVT